MKNGLTAVWEFPSCRPSIQPNEAQIALQYSSAALPWWVVLNASLIVNSWAFQFCFFISPYFKMIDELLTFYAVPGGAPWQTFFSELKKKVFLSLMTKAKCIPKGKSLMGCFCMTLDMVIQRGIEYCDMGCDMNVAD